MLKRYALPADVSEVSADLQRFSAVAASGSAPATSGKSGQEHNEAALAKAFFRDCDRIMKDAPGCSEELQVDALKKLTKLMESVTDCPEAVSRNVICPDPGVLEFACRQNRSAACREGECCTLQLITHTDFGWETSQAYKEAELRFLHSHPRRKQIQQVLDLGKSGNCYYTEYDGDKQIYFENPVGLADCCVIEVPEK